MDKMVLNKDDGTCIEVDIIMTFKLKEISDDNYVFYKDDTDNYYGAKFLEYDSKTNLITNLSDDEKKLMAEVFEKLRDGGII